MAKQTIKCNVESCKFQDSEKEICELDSIKVETLCDDECSTECDETCCGSFECDKDALEDSGDDSE